MSVKERLKEYIHFKKISTRQFEIQLGLSNGYINNIKKSISRATLENISMKHPNLNLEWLLLGEGEMLKGGWFENMSGFTKDERQQMLAKENIESNAIDLGYIDGDYETFTSKNGNEYSVISDNNYLLTVKLVSQKAYAGYLAGFSQAEYLKELPSLQTSVKNFHNGTYRAFEVKGDSMDCDKKYAIQEGDIAIGRQLHQEMWKYKLHIHDYKEWIIVHDGGIIIKHISAHDVENGVIHCVSYNDDKMIYPDFDLNLKDVYELYNVIKIEKFR